MIITEWRDFRMREHGQITSTEARLHSADRPIDEAERVIDRDRIVGSEDSFVAMDLDDLGGLIIWTKNKVWCTRYTGGDRERLVSIPRNPPATGAYYEWRDFIVHPLDSSRVRSRAERMDLSSREGSVVYPRSTILRGGDVFECM
jgi:hypothetical protein